MRLAHGIGAAALLLAVVPAWAGILPTQINEIRIDQPGSDVDEYFELSGEPGASLDGLTYLVIGDGGGGSGVIEAVVDLGGAELGPNGFLLVAEASFTLATADLTATLNDLCPRIDIRRTRHAPSYLRRLEDGQELPLDTLRGLPIEAACALANPDHFFDSLHRLGAKITATHVYPDHALLPQSLLNSDRPLVITQKDAAKLAETSNPNLWCLEIELRDFRG